MIAQCLVLCYLSIMICLGCNCEFDLVEIRKRNRSARGSYCSGECYRSHKKEVSEAHSTLPPKWCPGCEKERPSSDFRFKTKDKSKLQSYCRTCQDRYQKERCHKLKEKAIDLLGGMCSVCGLVDHPAVYDFHHSGSKGRDWTTLMKQSWTTIQKELSDCVLICSNCHRKKHFCE